MYIRTKDGVYELKENMTIENGVYSFFGKIYDTTEKHLFRNDKDLGEFVSQSENLEDLCDLFIGELDGKKVVLEKWNGNKFVIRWTVNMVSMIKDLNKTYANVKGAIYTDKGLIYVAKMNDKGELELI